MRSSRMPRPSAFPHRRTLEQVVGRLLDQDVVEFVVINLEKDQERGVYLTAKLALDEDNPVVRRIYSTVRDHVEKIDELITRGDKFSGVLARRMLSISEPAEDRLGFVRMGSKGYAFREGSKLGLYLYNALCLHRQFRKAVAREPDTLCLLPDFDLDRVSDFIVATAKQHFVEFTQEMARFYRFDPGCMRDVEIVGPWDPVAMEWRPIIVRLPVDDWGRAILLTPKSICRSGPAMTAYQYFRDIVGGDSEDWPEVLTKDDVMADAEANPGRLVRFAETRMKDSARFKPRREFQRKVKKKKR